MMRSLAVLLIASIAALAAPVPKELKTNATTVGVWRIVTADPQNPGKWTPSGQYWVIDADCGVTFGATPYRGDKKPSEIFKFDPKTGFVDHNLVGGKQRTLLGRYELKDDVLTICLDTAGTTRPESMNDPASTRWHMQRVKETK